MYVLKIFIISFNFFIYILVNYFTLLIHLNAELNPICHFLALLGAHHILHVNRIRVNYIIKYNFQAV